MGKGILTGLLEDIKDGMEDIDNNSISSSSVLKVVESKEVKAFDYSLVDTETAQFLQQKEVKITQIRMMSVFTIGKELKEAHERLANNRTGTFKSWVESLGISFKTSRNYINAYDYMVKNFHHIEDAEKIQPSLLFKISKPSTPLELQEAVISGDITTHKQYKEMEQMLKEAEKKASEAKYHYETISKSYDRLEKVNHEHYERAKMLEEELKNMKAELNDNTEIATAIVEKVPEEIYEELEELREQNLSAEINAELKSILKNLNKDVMGLALVLCRFKGKQISMDCIKIISEIRTNMIHLKSVSNQNLNKDLFDFIKD